MIVFMELLYPMGHYTPEFMAHGNVELAEMSSVELSGNKVV